MSSSPAVVVHKGGFLTALVKGIFGTIMVATVCATVLGVFGLRLADRHVTMLRSDVSGALHDVVGLLPEWRRTLPPSLSEALCDRRAMDYRDSVSISARLARSEPDERPVLVVDVTNKGDEIVSLLPLRLVVQNDEGVPVAETGVYAATPIQIGDACRGPLLPGATRHLIADYCHRRDLPSSGRVTWELTDVRVAAAVPQQPAAMEKHEE